MHPPTYTVQLYIHCATVLLYSLVGIIAPTHIHCTYTVLLYNLVGIISQRIVNSCLCLNPAEHLSLLFRLMSMKPRKLKSSSGTLIATKKTKMMKKVVRVNMRKRMMMSVTNWLL